MARLAGTAFAVFAISTAALADDRVELITGEALNGAIVERADDHVVFEHAVLGRLTIARDQIASLPELPETDVLLTPAEAVMEVTPDEPPRWKSEIDLGFSGAQGNTDVLDFRVGFLTVKKNEKYRWRVDAAYAFGERGGTRNQNRATAGIVRDWLLPDSPWLYFLQGRYDFDDFRDWTHRVSAHAGLGYEFLDTETFTLIGRVGAGASKQWDRTEPVRPEGLVSVGEFTWNISERQRVTSHATVYPDLGEFFEFRVVSGLKWTMRLDMARGLALNAGIDHEYESDVDPGIRNNDLKFFGGISFQF